MMNNYTYLTQIMRPARPTSMRAATQPGKINCVIAQKGTFATNDACLAGSSCGSQYGFDTTGHVCNSKIRGGMFPTPTMMFPTLTGCESGQTSPIIFPNTALQALGGFRAPDPATVQVNCITVDVVGGYVYVGGNFTTFAASPTPCVVAQYNMNTSTWVDAGNAAATFDGTSIYSMLLLPNQSLVVTGDFTSIGPSTKSSGPWAVFNPFSQTWAAMPGTFPLAIAPTDVTHSMINASVMNKSSSLIFLAGRPPNTTNNLTAMLLIYTVATGSYKQVNVAPAAMRNGTEVMCLDQTEQNLYINYKFGPSTSKFLVSVYNIANDTLAAIGTTLLPTKIRGIAVVLRSNVYYIAIAGVGSVLYDPVAVLAVNMTTVTTGLNASSFKAMYVDYYNNLYLGSLDGSRLYCLPSTSTEWMSPDNGVGNWDGNPLGPGMDGGVLAITGNGSATNSASANTLYIGGTFTSSYYGSLMSGFAFLANANLLTGH